MPTIVVLPKMGMTMTEGTLAQWLVPDGAPVEKGQPIFRMLTEKINAEVEAEASGVLRHLRARGHHRARRRRRGLHPRPGRGASL